VIGILLIPDFMRVDSSLYAFSIKYLFPNARNCQNIKSIHEKLSSKRMGAESMSREQYLEDFSMTISQTDQGQHGQWAGEPWPPNLSKSSDFQKC